jgi:hypothetical protein
MTPAAAFSPGVGAIIEGSWLVCEVGGRGMLAIYRGIYFRIRYMDLRCMPYLYQDIKHGIRDWENTFVHMTNAHSGTPDILPGTAQQKQGLKTKY